MRSAGTLLLLCSLAGCGESELEAGYFVSYDLHAKGILFDRLHVMLTREPRERPAPLTPRMLANGIEVPSSYEVRDEIVREYYVMEPTLYYRFEYEKWLGQWHGLLVIAFYGPDLVAAGFEPLTNVNYGNNHWSALGELKLEETAIELWGVEGPDEGSPWGPCTRLVGPVVQYVVRPIDGDCDGIFDHYDCQPYAYCPPDDPSSPTCVCP